MRCRCKCPVCGRFAPEAEMFEISASLAMEAGWVMLKRIRDGMICSVYLLCSDSCYQKILNTI